MAVSGHSSQQQGARRGATTGSSGRSARRGSVKVTGQNRRITPCTRSRPRHDGTHGVAPSGHTNDKHPTATEAATNKTDAALALLQWGHTARDTSCRTSYLLPNWFGRACSHACAPPFPVATHAPRGRLARLLTDWQQPSAACSCRNPNDASVSSVRAVYV